MRAALRESPFPYGRCNNGQDRLRITLLRLAVGVADSRPSGKRRADPIVIGVDTGGTFTDVAAVIDGELRIHKLLSTPHDPAAAVFEGVRALLGDASAGVLTYSSTVATNALLERRGARVALFTNAGFEDLIEIGRQNRVERQKRYFRAQRRH